jgi:hypothetical protein
MIDNGDSVEAKPLIDMWMNTFLVQIEARTGSISLIRDDSERPSKRRKVTNGVIEEENARAGNAGPLPDDFPMDGGLDFQMEFDMPFMNGEDYTLPGGLLKLFGGIGFADNHSSRSWPWKRN